MVTLDVENAILFMKTVNNPAPAVESLILHRK